MYFKKMIRIEINNKDKQGLIFKFFFPVLDKNFFKCREHVLPDMYYPSEYTHSNMYTISGK